MSLASSGPISIGGSDPARSINAQFGRAANAQTSMSQLYRSAGIVGAGAPNVPTSGPISLSQFYGAANAFSFNATIASNTTNYNLRNAAVAAGWDGVLPLSATVTVNSGVYVFSNSTATPAFDTGASFPAGSSLTLVNNGLIVGRGGNGGSRPAGAGPSGTPGFAGGTALQIQIPTLVNNAGTIGGGGGGGGSGSLVLENTTWVGQGGGGGGGRVNGAGGTASGHPAGTGGSGTLTAPGAGAPPSLGSGGSGGAGGNLGASGVNGQALSGAGVGFGGAAGAAVNGNANITWVATGTRLGAIS